MHQLLIHAVTKQILLNRANSEMRQNCLYANACTTRTDIAKLKTAA